ncbi:BRCT domain-containing DNA repair protein [Striga asiatica]|uniref:BRCT domain-containing DNA repair protein n=1 Tax=Striga asiatica TaxID=4170 RepID=A0A5A7NXX3_STRAF|nr:BRCT domain-containing DNA repair protein [Striga asiatica]
MMMRAPPAGARVEMISILPPTSVRNKAPSIKLLRACRKADSSTATFKDIERLHSSTIRLCLHARGLMAPTKSCSNSETSQGLLQNDGARARGGMGNSESLLDLELRDNWLPEAERTPLSGRQHPVAAEEYLSCAHLALQCLEQYHTKPERRFMVMMSLAIRNVFNKVSKVQIAKLLVSLRAFVFPRPTCLSRVNAHDRCWEQQDEWWAQYDTRMARTTPVGIHGSPIRINKKHVETRIINN